MGEKHIKTIQDLEVLTRLQIEFIGFSWILYRSHIQKMGQTWGRPQPGMADPQTWQKSL